MNCERSGLLHCKRVLNRGNKMKKSALTEEQAYRGLDGSPISLNTIDKSKLPNQNGYFLGATFGVLGLLLGLYGGIHYKSSDEEFYILLVLGSIMFVLGFAFVIKAAVYLLTWESFLQSANLTKCNIFCYVKIQECYDHPYRGKSSKYHRAYYTLKVCYIDIDGKKQEKMVKYLTAHNLQSKMQSLFKAEGDKTSLYGECIVAYNNSGKIRLIF